MLFNSYIYIFLLLPVTCILYFSCASRYPSLSKIWLIIASLFFYGWWNPSYIPLILASIVVNYFIGRTLLRAERGSYKSTLILATGIITNLITLGFFKYADFIIESINALSGQSNQPLNILLPLAISFFTFQQIAYLVDCAREQKRQYSFINYMLFVCFFPQLIAGPIVHHKEMMPQFENKKNLTPINLNIALGLLIFSMGLFKKIVFADTFAIWAVDGFDTAQSLSFLQAWATSFSYTFQLYFDFSGYTDMAIGSALLLNIKLPLNFNSPYKACSIQEFWRSWHITLSRFLRDYLYIPLGGSQCSSLRIGINLFVTFLLGGLWHGASWTFVAWGALHGFAMVVFRLWSATGVRLPRGLSWFTTFIFINFAWVIFRAESWGNAKKIFQGMINIQHIEMINYIWIGALALGFAITLFAPNTNRLRDMAISNHKTIAMMAGILMFISIFILEVRKTSEFLYFQF